MHPASRLSNQRPRRDDKETMTNSPAISCASQHAYEGHLHILKPKRVTAPSATHRENNTPDAQMQWALFRGGMLRKPRFPLVEVMVLAPCALLAAAGIKVQDAAAAPTCLACLKCGAGSNQYLPCLCDTHTVFAFW